VIIKQRNRTALLGYIRQEKLPLSFVCLRTSFAEISRGKYLSNSESIFRRNLNVSEVLSSIGEDYSLSLLQIPSPLDE